MDLHDVCYELAAHGATTELAIKVVKGLIESEAVRKADRALDRINRKAAEDLAYFQDHAARLVQDYVEIHSL